MKKSFFFKTALALFLSVGLLGLMVTGCKPLSSPDSTSFTVTFDSDGGSAVEPQTVKEGEFALRPESPEKEGYNFVDWFAPDATAAFDFGTPITADITLKAKWSIISYTVKFDSDGGSDVAPAIVEYGKTVTKPTDPVKDGFIFSGWFNGENEFNFGTPIKANLTLKAKWTVESKAVNVSIKIGEKEVKKVTIEKGESVTKPEITTEILTAIGKTDLKGYVTWDFDFSTKISAETTIVGTWHDVTGYVNTNPFTIVDAAKYSGYYLIPIDPAKAAADWESVSIKAKCLAMDGSVVTAAYSQAQVIAAKATTDWSEANKIANAYNLGATENAVTVQIPNGTDSVVALVIQRSDTDLDKIAYIEVTDISWTERNIAKNPELTSTGYVAFADIPGYPTDFDPDDYDQIWITVQLFDDNGDAVTSFPNADLGYSKMCLNDSNNSEALSGQYGPGYGDGFAMNYLNNEFWKGAWDQDHPENITIQYLCTTQSGTTGYEDVDGYKSMNCVSAQLDGKLKKIVFISFGGKKKE